MLGKVTVNRSPRSGAGAASQSVPVPDLLPGAEFAGCRIEAVAGRGGMGIVYRATQLSLGRPVALKLITPDRAGDPGFRERFERESRDRRGDRPPERDPRLRGGRGGRPPLPRHALREGHGPAAPARARAHAAARARVAAIACQIGAALDAAHAVGLVHRDVKPANVLLGGEHAYLADFGLSQVVGSDTRLTSTGQWIGTADFMAPEQFEGGEVDARADIYALGCVLYDALTGSVPYPRGTVPKTMIAHMQEEPPRPVGARRAARLRPRDRPRAGQGPGGPLSVGGRPRPRRERRRRGPARHRSPSASSPAAPPRPCRGARSTAARRDERAPPRRRPRSSAGARGETAATEAVRPARGETAATQVVRTPPSAARATARSTSRARRSRSATSRAAAAAGSPTVVAGLAAVLAVGAAVAALAEPRGRRRPGADAGRERRRRRGGGPRAAVRRRVRATRTPPRSAAC